MASKYRLLQTDDHRATQGLPSTTESIEADLHPARSVCVDMSFQHTVLDQGRLHYILRRLSDKRLKGSQQASQKPSRENGGSMLKMNANTRIKRACNVGSQENLVTAAETFDYNGQRS